MIKLYQNSLAKPKSLLLTINKTNKDHQITTTTCKIAADAVNDHVYLFFKNQNYQFIDTTLVDILDKTNRFTLAYVLRSMQKATSITIQIPMLPIGSIIITASKVFPAAMASEKEIYDMYGVFFKSHPDLRRILTDYSFKGHPLKKDFPLTGYLELRYSVIKKTLLFAPISLPQEFRVLSFVLYSIVKKIEYDDEMDRNTMRIIEVVNQQSLIITKEMLRILPKLEAALKENNNNLYFATTIEYNSLERKYHFWHLRKQELFRLIVSPNIQKLAKPLL